jgi:hypothetical protein
MRRERRKVERYIGQLPPLSKAISSPVSTNSVGGKILPGHTVLVHGLDDTNDNGKRGAVLNRTSVLVGSGLFIGYEVKLEGTGKVCTFKGSNLKVDESIPLRLPQQEKRKGSVALERKASNGLLRPVSAVKRNAMEEYQLRTNGVPIGKHVRIFGLKSSPELNGLIATVIRPLKKISPTGKEIIGYDVRMPAGLFSRGTIERIQVTNTEPA